ncbi:protein MIS12 homolog [Trichosurus vulpecula]|uniref:protein MIS12 homolog n=1 Tax=Trichosurus vulpecula TaxID=9337 RepID=UPI00186B585E|nr:protein MIS12 homolog [Trichosurus vulpecula]XP_036610574.1 protein MIS12 homolog [Trichosurus vulpecula]XP_036610575.1 protein MIS12 homolog [Trichosurus vulpecula]
MSINPMLYETQFFGFTPQTCMLRIYIAFQDYLFEVMVAVEKVILKKASSLPGCNLSAVQVRGSTETFLRFMRERFNRLFVKMEQVLLQLVLNVPPNILLPEDRSHEKYPQSREDFHLLQQQVEQLQLRYKAELGAKHALLAELEVQKVVQARLKKTLHWFDGLGDAHGPLGLGEMMAFLIQHSGRLRSITEDVTQRSGKVTMQ